MPGIFLPPILQRTGATFIGSLGINPPKQKVAAEAPASIEHLPNTCVGIATLSQHQKTLLAAATASGCDAVAYYRADETGALKLDEHIDLYPGKTTAFEAAITFNPNTHETPEHVRESKNYHIAVRDIKGTLQGIVVVHAPQEGYGRNRTMAEEAIVGDMHEPVASRIAKLAMATHIVDHEAFTLLPGWQGMLKEQSASHNSLASKQQYFKMLREDFIRSLGGEETRQAKHVTGVGDLMMLAVDKAINAPGQVVINEPQRSLLHDVTILHDVGKAQTSLPFVNDTWRVKGDEKESQARERYFMGENENHPVFTWLILSAYPAEALATAAHHHGLLRYSESELEKGLGDGCSGYKLLTDNIPAGQISPISHFMRICDVTEAITGKGGSHSLTHAITQLAERAGYDAASHSFKEVACNCNSIDPDYLCMMLDSGMFQAYGQMRVQQTGGWKDPNGAARYDEAAVNKIAGEVLEAYRWKERKAEVETRLRGTVARDAFVVGNSEVRVAAR